MTLKGHEKFAQRLNCGFQYRQKKKNKGLIFLQQEGRVEFSNFIGLFCLKGKLLEQKTFKRISFYDTEGIWNVWPKTELWFLNQTPENKTSHLLETNSPIFWENDLETTSFCPNFSWPFSVTKWSILVQAIYFSTKQTNKIWKLDPSRQRNAENVETFWSDRILFETKFCEYWATHFEDLSIM